MTKASMVTNLQTLPLRKYKYLHKARQSGASENMHKGCTSDTEIKWLSNDPIIILLVKQYTVMVLFISAENIA